MTFLKTQEKLIAEIHNEFDTAQDRLLQDAKAILAKISKEPKPEEQIALRLTAIGFTSTPVVKKAENIKEQRQSLVKTEEQASLIEYYKNTYPFLKFLTEEELSRICDKYNLIFAPVSNYIENVPEKNLRDIEQAQKLKEEDSASTCYELSGFDGTKSQEKLFLSLIGKDNSIFTEAEYKSILIKYYGHYVQDWSLDSRSFSTGFFEISQAFTKELGDTVMYTACTKVDKSELFIAAPSSHFNLEGLTKKSKHGFFNVFTQEVKDPIVFRYVQGGIQVLTKWGLEASDPALVVPVLN